MNAFYKLKPSRITLREMWWGTKNPLILLAPLFKLLPNTVNSNADDPAVETLAPFLVPYTQMPSDVYGEMYPLLEELAACGFYWPSFHAISGYSATTNVYLATLTHAHGQACARIHMRVFSRENKSVSRLFVTYFTEFADGSFLVTSSGKPDLDTPKTQQVRRFPGATAAELWAAHSAALTTESMRKQLVPAETPEKVAAVNERYHAQLRDYHLARGVFVPMNPEERANAEAVIQTAKDATAAGLAHGDVLAEIHQLQNKKVTWTSGITVLIVSVLLFVAAGARQWDWKTLCLILPVLFIHELGHYLAMLVFRYRNLRMFFIPLFGAAVTGQNYNVAGWKKAIVSLMGPVPGILLGSVVGVIGMVTHQELLIKAAIMLLIVNGMNLLPVLPLDGGWVLHTVLFSRHPVLDTAFRVLALGGLLMLGIFGGTRVLVYVAIPMALGLPVAYKLARITADLRSRGVGAAPSPDAQTLAPETAQTIVGEVRNVFPKLHAKNLARYTLNIYETLNARPPGALASLALLAVHGGSFILALILGVMFTVAAQGGLGGFLRAAAFQPQHEVACAGLQTWSGPKAMAAAPSRNTIVATFPTRTKAGVSFANLRSRIPDEASVHLFGDSVLLKLPGSDDGLRKEWFAQLFEQTTNTFVESTNLHASVTLMCLAKDVDDATALEEELTDYFGPAQTMRLIPPWQPGDARSAVERAQHQKARQTYGKLRRASYDVYKDPLMRASQVQFARAHRQGDTVEAKKIQEEQRELSLRLIRQRRDKIRSEGAGTVDTQLIDLYATVPTFTGTNYEAYRKALLTLAPRMGQLQCGSADYPERFAARSGSVSRAGLLLSFHWLTFDQLSDGLPAMVEWLCARGCVSIKYDFHEGDGGLDPGDLAEN